MQGIVDRFEDELAVIETRHGMIRINRKDLPADAEEGDLVLQQEGLWRIDRLSSRLRKQKIKKLADELWENQDS